MGLLQALNLPERPAAAGGKTTGAAADAVTAAAAKQAKLDLAAGAWRAAHTQADERIDALKAAIRSHYADAHPELLAEIEKGVGKFDAVLTKVDRSLADLMAHASQAGNAAARATELANAKTVLAAHIGYMKTEPLITHIDQNPFGVKTNLRVLLVTALSNAAKAIG